MPYNTEVQLYEHVLQLLSEALSPNMRGRTHSYAVESLTTFLSNSFIDNLQTTGELTVPRGRSAAHSSWWMYAPSLGSSVS